MSRPTIVLPRVRPPALVLAGALALLCGVSRVTAGGPRAVNGLGEPMKWNTTGPVVYNPDPGPLGLLSNVSARALLAEAFAEWAAGPADITFTEGTLLPLDVNGTGFAFSNPSHFQNFYRVDGDGKSPVIFDHDGSIIDALFGVGARFEILGVAGLDTPIGANTQITGASIIINGAFYDGVGMPASPDDVTLQGLKATMVHEIGHFLNLDHVVLNADLALDDNAGNDIYVSTMFPIAVQDEAALATLNPDDQRAAQSLYPAGSGQTLSGSVSFSGIPFQGANVVLRKTDDPLMTAYSVISGGLFFPCNPASTCDPCATACDPGNPPEQGEFTVDLLPAGSYRVCVEQIDRRFTEADGTFVGPLATPPVLPGPEECYDAAEAGTSADDPDDALAVTGGGGPIDIILNTLPSSDPFEPNNTLPTGATLADLPGGSDTVPGVLGAGDLDVFNVPVTAGQRIRIDLDADEMGSNLDAVVGFYDASNILIALSDDAVDPDTRAFSRDPALELVAGFTGTAKVVISSFPDLDQNGTGGVSTGGYWLHVEVASDADADGTPDAQDICPATARDDADRDGLCFGADNCPTRYNPAQDAPYKLSGTMVAGGAVTFFSLTLDYSRVVYIADQDADEVFQVYSVPVSGGSPPVRLNPSFAGTGKDVTAFLVSPDSSTVVYMADQDNDEEYEIYSVPIGGGSSTQLNGALVTGGDVLEFNISPDGARVVYRADQDVDPIDELFSVPIGGGSSTQLNDPFVAGGSMVDPGPGFSSFLFSPDGTRVLYAADQDTFGRVDLYGVPVTGGGTTKLNGTLVAGGNVANFFLTDNTRVIFRADSIVDNRFELYSVLLTGGAATRLNPNTAGSAGVQSFRILYDGSRVFYRAAQDVAGRVELYSVPADGSAGPTKLNSALVTGGNVLSILLPVGPGDGNRLAYRADQNTDEVFEIFSVPLTGGSVIKLNPTLVTGGDVTLSGDIFLSRVIYGADQETDDQFEDYTVSTDGTNLTKISGTQVPGGDFQSASYTTSHVALLVDKDTDGVNEVYGSHLFGGQPLKLNASLVAGGNVSNWDFSDGLESDVFVYLADQEVDERFELYARPFSLDRDADGVFDACDVCAVAVDASQADTDGNGLGDACQTCSVGNDPDGDGVCGAADNCPTVSNAGQADFDLDGAGDACDIDDDNDGLADVVETNTGTFVSAGNTGTNPLDADSDNDGVSDGDEVLAGTNPNAPASSSPSLVFGNRRVVGNAGLDPVSVFAADIDGDGDQDIVSAVFTSGVVAWYENNGASPPAWTERVVSDTASQASSVAAADVDGDGDMDILSGDTGDTHLNWYENNGASPPTWTEHLIGSNLSGYSSVVAVDIDRDGDMDVLSAAYAESYVAWHESNGASPPEWTEHVISTTGSQPYTVFAADFDGDGDMDAVSADQDSDTIVWYENDGASPLAWTERTISTTADGARCVVAADMDGDGDMDVVSASYIDNNVAWYENSGAIPPVWTKHVILTTANGADSVFAADMDGDRDVDVLSASFDDNAIRWFENDGASTPGFSARVINASSIGADSVFATDADGDGDLDVLAASQDDNTVAWFENRMIHRSADFLVSNSVSTSLSRPNFLSLVDVDADGDLDVVSASSNDDRVAWEENDGGSPAGWTTRTITTGADGVEYIDTADMDGDGDLDVLSASFIDDTIAWYESNGASPPVWTEHIISTAADGAWSVEAGDLDGDGDMDVVSVSFNDNKLAWYESDGFSPPGWTEHSIETGAPLKRGLAIADLDRDGDLDVLTARVGPGTIAWYDNDGGSPPSFTTRVVNPTEGIGTPGRVVVADVDGDGDLDIVSGATSDSLIAWFESDGAQPPAFTVHLILAAENGWFAVNAADLDGDGDIDLMAGSSFNKVAWWENNGAATPGWTQHVITLSVDDPAAVVAGDVDNDGDMDVVTADAHTPPSDIVMWENRGGQFALDTTVPAGLPASLAEGSKTALLSISLTSNGRAGDSAVELATLDLLVTDASGATLSSEEANGLIERLRIYRDTGSGVFEGDRDTLVATVDTLELSPQVIEFATGDPRVRVGPGQSKTFFVVAELSATASTQSPNSFRLTHVAQSGSKARDASTGALLRMEDAANAGTGTITAVDDATPPFVTSIFPRDHEVDVSLSTSVVLFFSEPVDRASAASGVALYAGGAKLPGAVSVDGPAVIIDPESNLSPATDYVVQVTSLVRDADGNPALPFVATFTTTASASSGTIAASDFGEDGGGATLIGGNADDNSGFAAAALGDINGTAASGGIADLIIGAPNTDLAAADAGKATLIFGTPGLQSNTGAFSSLTYSTGTLQDFVGETVAAAGDLNGDTVRDFFIGAPHSDQTGANAGVVYLVFGHPGLDELAPATLDLDNLASCAAPTLCGVKFLGAAAGDLAGASLSWAGDVNGDGNDDVVIGAPGASPGGRTGAGSVYLVYGPLAAGIIPLAQVGVTVHGLRLDGESAGDHLGAAVSLWPDESGDGFDDLLLGAPGATSLNEFGVPIPDAGYVYALQGGEGPGRLDDTATPGIIEMSRVASGGSDQVAGMVFIGGSPDGNIGRSLTGAVDIDGNGVDDILMTGDGVAFAIPGDDPKTKVGSTSSTPTTTGGGGLRAGLFDMMRDFGAVMYVSGNNDPLTVGPAGDLNNDGYGDFIIGAPFADTSAGVDAGRAYIILGSPVPGGDTKMLDDVGGTIDGFIVEGAAAGDNLGASVGGGYDLNADGVDDGLVGAPFADTAPTTPPNAGETYVISPLRPGEVTDLELTDLGSGIARLEWSAPDLAVTYNVYRGQVGTLLSAGMVKTSNMTHLACGISTDADADLLPDTDDASLPPTGDSWFYLVTARNLQGEGPLGPPNALPPPINDQQCP